VTDDGKCSKCASRCATCISRLVCTSCSEGFTFA
jgi:hypothetical protein